MANKDNQSQRFIYIRSLKEKVPCTEQRFRNLLCRLCVQIGKETSEGIIIPYIFTHDDFAQMISAGRSSISRIMGSFQDKGYILFEGKHIIIRPEIIGLGML